MDLRAAGSRIVLALDVPTLADVRLLISQVGTRVGMFKVGKRLFTAAGPAVCHEISALGGSVLLDLKDRDIPNMAAGASEAATKLGVKMFTVHCAGGLKMMRAAREAARATAAAMGQVRPHILGVTILTSADYATLVEVLPFLDPNLPRTRQDNFMLNFGVHLARLAQKAGLDGVVASPQEVGAIRAACGSEFLIASAGIRLKDAAMDDQTSFGTPRDAIRAGATHLIVGRPITAAANPVFACDAIIEEVALALEEMR